MVQIRVVMLRKGQKIGVPNGWDGGLGGRLRLAPVLSRRHLPILCFLHPDVAQLSAGHRLHLLSQAFVRIQWISHTA